MSDLKTAEPAPLPATASAEPGRSRVAAFARQVPGPLIGLVAIVIVFSIASPYFLTVRNLVDVFSQISEIGIMSVGAALVIITGGIDLSVGAVLAVSLMVTAWSFRDLGVPFPICMIVGIAVGALVGLLNGVLSTYARIQPFVATLATMSACSGIALFITNGSPITGFPDFFTALTSIQLLGVSTWRPPASSCRSKVKQPQSVCVPQPFSPGCGLAGCGG